MPGGGNRDKFGQTFDKTEKRGFQQIKNIHEVSTLEYWAP
jgi:hypothetical protein